MKIDVYVLGLIVFEMLMGKLVVLGLYLFEVL